MGSFSQWKKCLVQNDLNGTHNHVGGHFLNQDVGVFDAGFFNVHPSEAASMDPQQRLLLETTYEALESAGVRQEDLKKSNTAVYMAMFTRDYDRNTYKDMMSIPKYHVTGTGDAILANRISYLFDLNGPSVTIDTGCSGGMAAISHACQALRSGQSDIALAGAANLILSPDHMIGMSKLHMLNKDGKSYSFDSRGEGYGRGEGIATLVIKRLDDAIRDNDPIRAILRDAAINQDGHTTGITLPNGSAQEALERQVWNNLNLDPLDVGYVEAHGTGTLAGDGAELEGISRVFCQKRDASNPLVVGSIKSNIGHLECASGLAAMIKAILVLERGAIPPNVNFDHPKPNLNLEEKKIQVPRTLQKWRQRDVARVSINSFGYGGTNAHAVIERPSPRAVVDDNLDMPRLFTLSAANQASLQNMLATMADWVSKREDQPILRDLSYTLLERRSVMPWRFSCVAASHSELVEALSKASQTTDAVSRISPDVKINFIFSGQGAQWAGMGRELLGDPTFHHSIHQSNKILAELGSSWDLVEELLRDKATSRLGEAELAQPATTAVQIALVDMVRNWGLIPDAVVGHSSGEIAAAYAAGHLSQHQAIKAAYYRGFSSTIAKSKGFGKGGMLAVGLGEDEIQPYLERLQQGKAVVACQNSPSSSTISGDDAAIFELSELLTKDDAFNRRLLVDTAYHSHHMQAAAEEYRAKLGNIGQSALPATAVKMFSSVTGSLKSSQFDGDYWVSNLVGKVRFCDALQALCRADQASAQDVQPHRIFIEIGPHAALAGPARQCIAELEEPLPYSYTSVLVRGTHAVHSALTMAGSLFLRGYSLETCAVAASDPTRINATVLFNLPSYSWDHSKRYWHESRLSRDYRLRKHPYHDLLGLRMTDNTPLRPVWRHLIGVEGLPWLRDHVVDDLIVFPGAGYLCMAMEAASQLASDRYPEKKTERMRLQNVSFLKGLVVPEGRARVELQLAFSPIEGADTKTTMQHSFSITACTSDEHWNEHCRGSIAVEFASEKQQRFETLATYGEVSGQLDLVSTQHIQSSQLYQDLRKVGNAYGPTFSGIRDIHLGDEFASSTIAIPDVRSVMPANYVRPHIIHPTTLDILLHTTLPLVNQKLGAGSVMPVRIGDLVISSDIENAPHTIFSAVTTLTSSHFRAAEADMVVFPGNSDSTATPIISILGMELRSLASEALEDADGQDRRNICYELFWGPDERFLSAESLKPLETMATDSPLSRCLALLSEYLKHKAFKQSDFSVIEIAGSSSADATSAFLKALSSHKSLPSFYDLASQDTSDSLTSELQEWSSVVNVRSLNINEDTVSQGFQQNSYDVLFACNTFHDTNLPKTLSNVRQLLKPDGVLLLIQDMASLSADGWSTALSQASFELQFAVESDNLSFMVARAIDSSPSAISIRFIVEPSVLPSMSSVVDQLPAVLMSKGVYVTTEPTTSWSDTRPNDDAINIVIDDASNPILSGVNEETFRNIVNLFQKPTNVLWLSMQKDEKDGRNPKKHLITGVARSAHAENDRLEMVTVDVQQAFTEEVCPALLDFLSKIILSFPKKGAPREREYIYTGTDVLVPRLIPSDTLNRQISGTNDKLTQPESYTHFRVPLKLDTRKDGAAHTVFIEDESHHVPLDETSIEIDARAFGLGSNSFKGSITVSEYAGVVVATGSRVSAFKIGDRVVAWGTEAFASRPRVPSAQAQLLPDTISFVSAAALPVSFMTACHALTGIVNIQPAQVVLVDGATSDIGQAAILVARHLGARVVGAVNRSDEATFLQQAFSMSSEDIIPRDSPFLKDPLRKLVGTNGVDVVLGCAMSSIPKEMVNALKPFGTLVQIRSRGIAQAVNGTVATFDLGSLTQADPLRASQLLERVMKMVGQGLSLAPFKMTTLPLNGLDEALRLARSESVGKCVVQVDDVAMVKVERPSYIRPGLEASATYVVAGGLGDLGQRFLQLMAKAGARYFVTLSRSGASPTQREKIEKELQRLSPGSVLHCLKCDVSQESSVSAALSEIKAAGLPTVKGVIQGSLVLRDSILDNMTAEDFDSVLQAKAYGTLNLQKVFEAEDLTFFISLSSAVNMIGSAGQANYNAANSLQDAIAQFDRSSDCFYMALNIGLIEDATVNNDVIIQSVQRQGLTTIYHDELNAYFEYALSAEARQVGLHQAVIGFTPESIGETTAVSGTAKTLMFTHVRQTAKRQASDDDRSKKTKTFEEYVAQTDDKDEIASFVAQLIGNKLADLMSIDPIDMGLDEPFLDFGLDSLIAIELRNWIMREFSAPIQSSEVLDSLNILALAQKVTLRSNLLCDDETDGVGSSEILPASTRVTTRSPSQEPTNRLRPLPIPALAETLRMFADSRKAICSPQELEETERVLEEFSKSGAELQESLRANPLGPDSRLEFYDNHLHMERREALQDHALFWIGHLTDGAPKHTQAERAAIVTMAAFNFKKRLENGLLEQHTLNDITLDMETLQWLFHTSQEPGREIDLAQKYAPNNKVVVMRRGHLYEISVHEDDDYASFKRVFAEILLSSEQALPPVSVLTTRRRDEWDVLRAQVKAIGSNTATLDAIESCAFVVCLDDAAPETSSERCTSILLNDRHLTNRWLDKMLQFTISANGVSALVGENSKLDGLSARQLSEYVTDEILNTESVGDGAPASTVRELILETSPAIEKAISEQTQRNLAHYKIIGSSRCHYPALNRSFIGNKGLRSKGTVLMAILMATRMFYGHFEPAWETVTLAKYARGRIDWLQNLTPDIVSWIEAALEFKRGDKGDTMELASQLKEAAISHVQSLQRVADGRGYVESLYALMGVALAEGKQLPALFDSAAWKYSDRHLSAKKVKIDCLGSGGYLRMQEGGFLMPNPDCIFIHYEVHHPDPLVTVHGRESDVARFEGCLVEAMETVRTIIEQGFPKV
ncbi:beta-ketoacyl synthase domain-containing protein [Trichoderma harzianum]|uniref:Beta-ketoacyl synthase domain-containing protein n=1 Tax=Trichoderma harzianum TaxID=5544 RepID=A0A0F9X6J3_TRIHA|nr:beta-ketoacyl synthase domain-containing protein [Trichoderma harzianum]